MATRARATAGRRGAQESPDAGTPRTGAKRTVMGVMGWSNTAMAARYQHNTAAIRRDVAERVGGLLWRPSGTSAGCSATSGCRSSTRCSWWAQSRTSSCRST